MEESLRRTAYQNNQFRFNNFQQGNNNQTLRKNKSRDTLINNQKRQKLKNALMDRFQRIFGANANFNIINYEVENFLSQTNLTENDLRILEANLRKKLNIPFESKTNRNKSLNPNNKTKKNRYNNTNKLRTQQKNLSNNINLTVNNNNTTNKIFNPFSNTSNNIVNDNESKNSNTIILPSIGKKKRGFWDACDPNESRMSGGSDIDNFNEVRLGDKLREQEMKDFEKIAENKEFQKKKKKNQIDYSKYADEWDAINMYNKKMFEEQKRLEKIKDYQVKQRVKKELDNQIKQKIKKEYEQKLKDDEFNLMEKKHLQKIEELEKQKAEAVKALVIK